MLLPSDRHQPADMRLWVELERADLVHGASYRMTRQEAFAVAAAQDFLASGPCYVSLSGGKDSACLAVLLHRAGVLEQLPAVWFRAVPKHNPDVPVALGALSRKLPDLNLRIVDYESPVPSTLTRLQAESIARRNFDAACKSAEKQFGRRILGIRSDESGSRKISFRRWGRSTENSCRPLATWSIADVYGYTAIHGVPLHPAYGMLGGGRWPREHIRIDALMGSCGDEFGRREWELEYYGDVIRRLECGTLCR